MQAESQKENYEKKESNEILQQRKVVVCDENLLSLGTHAYLSPQVSFLLRFSAKLTSQKTETG